MTTPDPTKNISFVVLQNSARLTVPGGASVACSTAKAIEWDASWSNNLDPSGRAALGVHRSAYDKKLAMPSVLDGNLTTDSVPRMMGVHGPGLSIRT